MSSFFAVDRFLHLPLASAFVDILHLVEERAHVVNLRKVPACRSQPNLFLLAFDVTPRLFHQSTTVGFLSVQLCPHMQVWPFADISIPVSTHRPIIFFVSFG